METGTGKPPGRSVSTKEVTLYNLGLLACKSTSGSLYFPKYRSQRKMVFGLGRRISVDMDFWWGLSMVQLLTLYSCSYCLQLILMTILSITYVHLQPLLNLYLKKQSKQTWFTCNSIEYVITYYLMAIYYKL